MVQKLYLIEENDNWTGERFDLLTGVFQLADGGWEASEADGAPVWETFYLVAKGPDQAIRFEWERLEKTLAKAVRYHEGPYQQYPIWLRVISEGEAMFRQSPVLDYRLKLGIGSNAGPLLGANTGDNLTVVPLILSILRMPFWEGEYNEHGEINTYPTYANGMSVNGGYLVSGPGVGGLDNRIEYLQLGINDPSSIAELSKIWVGIRRKHWGTTNFRSVWEAENGTNVIADTTDIVENTTASNNSKIRIAFTTSTALVERAVFKVEDLGLGANYAHMIGEYLVLGRVKLDAATTEVRLQLRQGFYAYRNLNEIVGDTYVSGVQNSNLTSWNLVELGRVSMPPSGFRSGPIGEAAFAKMGFQLFAERISVAGYVEIDNFILIPLDAFVYLEDAKVGLNAGHVYVFDTATGERFAYGSTTTYVPYSINASFGDYAYPVEGGICVVAAQTATSHPLTEKLYLDMFIFPQYSHFKAANTLTYTYSPPP